MGRRGAWLRLIGCERGNSALVSAAVLPLLISSAAVAYDTVQFALWIEQLQGAADAGALAGAEARAAGRPPAPAVDRAVNRDPRVRIVPPVLVEEAGSSTAVRVVLTARRDFPFLGAMMNKPAQRSVQATAFTDSPAREARLAR
jgi:hypothetical protein